MFPTSPLVLLFTLALAFVARADVSPSEPSPGSVYPEGGSCPIVWEGDSDSATAWKNMAIELMTGDNFNMKHVTTVTTGQDGTVNGNFEWPCPVVTLHSAVYFYQFSAPGTSDKTWTTRFVISSAAGATTPPPNPTQPGTGDSIPWGVGALADPSKASPPPSFGGSGTSGTVGGPPSSSGILVASATTSSTSTLVMSTSNSPPAAILPTSSTSRLVTVIATPSFARSSAPSATNTDSASGTGSSGAIALSATSALASLIIPAFALMLF